MLIDPFFSKQLPVFHKAILMQAQPWQVASYSSLGVSSNLLFD